MPTLLCIMIVRTYNRSPPKMIVGEACPHVSFWCYLHIFCVFIYRDISPETIEIIKQTFSAPFHSFSLVIISQRLLQVELLTSMKNGSALVLFFNQNLIVPEILILNGNRHAKTCFAE